MIRQHTPAATRRVATTVRDLDAYLRYRLAYSAVRAIDGHLARGTRHYRNRAGVLLTTLEEVVRAVIDDDLQEEHYAQ